MTKLDTDSLPKTVKDTDGNDVDVVSIAADESSPSAMLAGMAATAPAPIAAFIEQQCMNVLATEMPKLYAVSKLGPARRVDECNPLAEIYSNAMVKLDAEIPEDTKQLTATVRDAALELAEVLDKSVKRILLDDVYVNRLALMDMSSIHARLTKVLAEVALTPEQIEQVEEANAA